MCVNYSLFTAVFSIHSPENHTILDPPRKKYLTNHRLIRPALWSRVLGFNVQDGANSFLNNL